MHPKNVTKKQGKFPGPTLAVFAGVHGDEKAGVFALEKVINEIELRAGTVYFVHANPKAIEKGVRFTEKNLNRCFLSSQNGGAYEECRARELISLLDECDALLDLHASNSEKSTPFIICESDAYDIAEKLDFTIISSGWDDIEPGATDGYMYRQGKPGLCLECGPLQYSREHAGLAEKSIYQFLKYFGCIWDKSIQFNNNKQSFIWVQKCIVKQSEDFYLAKKYNDFDRLADEEVIAYENGKPLVAEEGECIIFPDDTRPVGHEVFILGKYIS